MARGATVMMVLMIGTVGVMPIGLPLAVEGISVDAGAIVVPLLIQMMAPMIVGMLLNQLLESPVSYLQPWVARFSTISLVVLIIATLIGYSTELDDGDLWKASITGLAVLAVAFFLGFMMGDGRDQLKEVSGLGTAQRGTAAAIIVATNNFSDSRVLVVILVVNTLGLLLLIGAAKVMSAQNTVTFDPPGADVPRRRTHRPPAAEPTR